MVSPDESAGTEECFLEAQLKAMAGVFQGLLDKALTEPAQGSTTSEREDENAERDPTGEIVQGMAGGTDDGQRVYIRKHIHILNTEGQVRGAGGLKGAQGSPQVPVRERAELDSTQQAPGNVRCCKMVQGGTGDTGGRQRVGVRKYIKGCRGPKGGPRIHPRYLSERGLS